MPIMDVLINQFRLPPSIVLPQAAQNSRNIDSRTGRAAQQFYGLPFTNNSLSSRIVLSEDQRAALLRRLAPDQNSPSPIVTRSLFAPPTENRTAAVAQSFAEQLLDHMIDANRFFIQIRSIQPRKLQAHLGIHIQQSPKLVSTICFNHLN